MCQVLRKCANLKLFRLNSWRFEREQLLLIMSALCDTEKSGLSVIDVGSNQLARDDAKLIMDLIRDKREQRGWFSQLKEVNFVGNYITGKQWSEQLIDVHSLGDLVFI